MTSVIVEYPIDGPLKKAEKDAVVKSTMSEFAGAKQAGIINEYYVERRAALEPQTFALVINVISDAVALATALLSLTKREKEGKIRSVSIGDKRNPIRVRGEMTIDDVIKLIQSVEDRDKAKED